MTNAPFFNKMKNKQNDFAFRLGLGVFFSWFWATLQNPNTTLFQRESLLNYSSYWAILLLSTTASFLFILISASKLDLSKRESFAARITFAILAIYSLVLYVPALSGLESPILECAKVAIVGIMAAWLFVQWGSSAGKFGPKQLLEHSFVALIICFFLTLLLHSFRSSITIALTALLPLASAGIMHGLHISGWDIEKNGYHPANETSENKDSRFHITVLVQGMALGLLHFMYGTITLEKCNDPYCVLRFLNSLFPQVAVSDFYGFMGIFGALLAATIMIVVTRIVKLNFRKMIYVVGFPLMALGFLILATDNGLKMAEAVSHASGVGFTAGEVVYIAGYLYAVATSWALCSYLSRIRCEDRVTIYAQTGLFLITGQLLGFVLSMLVGFNRFTRADFCMMTLFILMITSLLIATDDELWNSWGGAKPNETDRPSSFKLACDTLSRNCRLTERERDVFMLLARGRNMAFIAEALCVTKDTVKTHCRSLYRKLGVHSQQELIDRVEEEINLDKNQRIS